MPSPNGLAVFLQSAGPRACETASPKIRWLRHVPWIIRSLTNLLTRQVTNSMAHLKHVVVQEWCIRNLLYPTRFYVFQVYGHPLEGNAKFKQTYIFIDILGSTNVDVDNQWVSLGPRSTNVMDFPYLFVCLPQATEIGAGPRSRWAVGNPERVSCFWPTLCVTGVTLWLNDKTHGGLTKHTHTHTRICIYIYSVCVRVCMCFNVRKIYLKVHVQ